MRIIQRRVNGCWKNRRLSGRVQISDCHFGATGDAFHLEQWDVDLGYLQYIALGIYSVIFYANWSCGRTGLVIIGDRVVLKEIYDIPARLHSSYEPPTTKKSFGICSISIKLLLA
jgi:hypothetical protein